MGVFRSSSKPQLLPPQLLCEHQPVFACLSPLRQRTRTFAFCQLFAVLVEHQLVMMPFGHRQPQQLLQHAVNMRRAEQIGTARYKGHAVRRIIERRRKVIAGGQVLAHNHHVSEFARIGDDAARDGIDPDQLSRLGHQLIDVEPQRCRLVRIGGWTLSLARARIKQTIYAPPFGQSRDLRARAGATVEQAASQQKDQPWDEILSLFSAGKKEADQANMQLQVDANTFLTVQENQREAFLLWKEALEKLKQPPSEDNDGQGESQSQSDQGETGEQDQQNQSMTAGNSQNLQYKVLPVTFTTLAKGGIANNLMVEGIVVNQYQPRAS